MLHFFLRRSVYVTLVIALLFVFNRTQASDLLPLTSGEQSAEPDVRLLSDGIELTWRLPAVSADDGLFEIDGFQLDETPGRPMLPTRSFGVALPPEGRPSLAVGGLGKQNTVRLSQPVPLAPVPDGLLYDENGVPFGVNFSPAELGHDGFDSAGPAEWITFEEIGTMAGVRLGRITLNPILPAGGADYLSVREISVKLDFQVEVQATRSAELSGLQASILDSLINPAQVVVSFSDNPNSNERSADFKQRSNLPTAIIETDGSVGMVAVNHEKLLAAGLPLDQVNPTYFHLYKGETEIAWEIIGNGSDPDRFEAGEVLVFYAPGEHSRWTVNEVFRLTVENTPGRRFESRGSAATGLPLGKRRLTVLAEEDFEYTPQCLQCGSQPLGRDGDRWMWQELKRPGAASADFQILTPNYSSAEPAELTVWLMGLTDLKNVEIDHFAAVYLNDIKLGDIKWGGKTAKHATLAIPAGILRVANQVTVTLEDTGEIIDGVWVDAFELEYTAGNDKFALTDQISFQGEEIQSHYEIPIPLNTTYFFYDVTLPEAPVNLTGFTMSDERLIFSDLDDGERSYQLVAPSAFHLPTDVRGAKRLLTEGKPAPNYLILTAAAFSTELEPLVNHRTAQGYSVAIEEVGRIYDQFGDGTPNPAAIKSFLQAAWGMGQSELEIVLLVGDGHYDPRLNLDASVPVQLPPFLIEPSTETNGDIEGMGETAADNRFVTFDGPDDLLPELAIGRLPVNSREELRIVVEKIVSHDSAEVGDWSGTFTIVGDNADSGGDFVRHSNSLIESYFPAPWRTNRYYFSKAFDQGSNFVNRIINGWNSGNSMVMYTGHSSIRQWGTERLFHFDDVETLEHAAQLPLVLAMTCFTSSYHYPDAIVLDEQLLLHDQGGAVATWGSTGIGVSTGHKSLANGFLNSIFNGGDQSLGEATLAGKLRLVIDQSNHVDLLDTFTLLGDPATQMRFEQPPELITIFLPVVGQE